MVSLFQSCALLLSYRLYYFNLHDDYPPFLYTTQSIYIAALPFLINWNEKRCSESNILTMDRELVLENCSSAAANTLQNTIIYLKAVKYQTETDLSNGTGTWDKGAKEWGSNAVLWLQGFRTKVLEIKNTVVVLIFIFLKDNGLCGRLADSNYCYRKQTRNQYRARIFSCMCNAVCVYVTCTVVTLHAICEGLFVNSCFYEEKKKANN